MKEDQFTSNGHAKAWNPPDTITVCYWRTKPVHTKWFHGECLDYSDKVLADIVTTCIYGQLTTMVERQKNGTVVVWIGTGRLTQA